jgi:hypothetical protein
VKSLYFVGIPAHISSQIISVTQNLSDGLRAVVMSSARRKFSIEGVAQFTYPSSSWRNVLPTLTMLAVVPPVSLVLCVFSFTHFTKLLQTILQIGLLWSEVEVECTLSLAKPVIIIVSSSSCLNKRLTNLFSALLYSWHHHSLLLDPRMECSESQTFIPWAFSRLPSLPSFGSHGGYAIPKVLHR